MFEENYVNPFVPGNPGNSWTDLIQHQPMLQGFCRFKEFVIEDEARGLDKIIIRELW